MSYYQKSKKTKNTEDEFPYLAVILVFIVLVAIIGFVSVFFFDKKSAIENIDHETFCVKENLAQKTLILVDTSDKLSPIQKTALNERLWNYVKNIEKNNHQVLVFSVENINDKIIEPILKICNPGDAKNVNSLIENKKIISQNFEKHFKDKIDNIFVNLLDKESSQNSPIMESIQSIAVSNFIADAQNQTKNKIIIISDLLQNTENFSFYKGDYNFEKFIKGENYKFLKADFDGAEIELYFLNRRKDINLQNENLREFWIKYFQNQNATVSRFLPIEG